MLGESNNRKHIKTHKGIGVRVQILRVETARLNMLRGDRIGPTYLNDDYSKKQKGSSLRVLEQAP